MDFNPVGGGNPLQSGQAQVGLFPDFDLLVVFVTQPGQLREPLLRQAVLRSERTQAVNQSPVNWDWHPYKMVFLR